MFAYRVAALRLTALSLVLSVAACGHVSVPGKRAMMSEKQCMTRVMYFESNRSSDDGMLAVGTVVMNRVKSDKFPNTVCGVVGQKNQFAPGVLSKPMKDSGKPRAERMADKVLRGARHREVGKAMFFHTAGYNFSYNNMDYKVIAGGNAFYDKRQATADRPNTPQIVVAQRARMPQARPGGEIAIAQAPQPAPVVVASAAPVYSSPAPAWTPPPPAWAPPSGDTGYGFVSSAGSVYPASAPSASPGSIEDLIAFN
jgi:hypothetical protein